MRDASIKAMPSEKDKDGQPLARPTLYRIQFVEQAAADQTVLMEFRDPVPRKAVRISAVLEAPPADSANLEPNVPGNRGRSLGPGTIRGGATNCRTGSPGQRLPMRCRPSWSRSATPR